MNHGKSVLIVALLAIAGSGYAAKKYFIDSPPAKIAKAYTETFPVRGAADEDPADDIAIHVDPADPSKTLIVAVDRDKGLAVYDLKGDELDFLEAGKLENIDLRPNVKLGDREITLVATADNENMKVLLYELGKEKPYLRALPGGSVDAPVKTQGLCLYRNPATGEISIYVIGEERDPVREARAKLQKLKKEKIAVASGEIADGSENKTGGKKADKKTEKNAPESAAPSEALKDEAEKVAKKAERKTKREEEKAKEKVAKSKPSEEEEELTKLAAQPTKKGRQWFAVQSKLTLDESGSIKVTEHRRIHLDSKCEGSIVDDELGVLFISEEKKGVWRFAADGPADRLEVGQLICKVEFPNPLRDDVEGIALYPKPNGQGYLIVCSEGSDDFVVLDRQKPHDYIGRFRIAASDKVDGVENCDSIDVVNANLGGPFGEGLVVVQDDHNESIEGTREKANFKLVPWSEVAGSFNR